LLSVTLSGPDWALHYPRDDQSSRSGRTAGASGHADHGVPDSPEVARPSALHELLKIDMPFEDALRHILKAKPLHHRKSPTRKAKKR